MMAEQQQFHYTFSPGSIKPEPESENELEVYCKLCNKVFASCVALQNHARIMHSDAYETGDPKMWTVEPKIEPPETPKQPKLDANSIKSKTDEIVSRMKPTSVTSLATQDISYIIIKSDEPLETKKRQKRKKEVKAKEDKVKPRRAELRKEAEVITGPFECLEKSTLGADGTCHQMFFSCCEYSDHQLAEHMRPRRRAARCQVCERPLSQLHQSGPKDFTCELCLEGFDTVTELLEHKNVFHFQTKRFECSVCFKKFSAQGGVVQHMRMHTGDRPYSCTYCPKSFSQKSGLEQHTRTHTKVKPFRCVICSKTFIQTVHLKQHMRTHTNVAPFQCVICEKRFKQSSHLNYHLKNHPANMTDEQKQKYRQIVSNHQRRDQEVIDANQIKVETINDEIEGQGSSQDGNYEIEGDNYVEGNYEIEGDNYEIEENCEVDGSYEVSENYEMQGEEVEGQIEGEEVEGQIEGEEVEGQIEGEEIECEIEGEEIEEELEEVEDLGDGYEVIYEDDPSNVITCEFVNYDN